MADTDNDTDVQDDAGSEDVTETDTDTTDADTEDEPKGEAGEDQGETWDPERAKAAIRKKNREAESLRRRLKEAEPLLAKLKELEDAGKSETERLTERATKTEQAAKDLALENNRLKLRLDLGLSEDQAKRVSGDNYEDMKADAEDLLKLFKSTDERATRKTAPAKELKGGLDPSADDDKFDAVALAERIRKKSNLF